MSSAVGAEPQQPALLLLSLQKDCSSLEDASELMCAGYQDDLSVQEVGEMYASTRLGGVSIRQVMAAISKVCGKNHRGRAKKSQMPSIFIELDRRYFIIENARWEFSMLDGNREGQISERNAKSLFKTVQGSQFLGGWTAFQKKRLNTGSKITWEEIEVPICEICVEGEPEEEAASVSTDAAEKEPDQDEGSPLDEEEVSTEDKIAGATAREEAARKLATEAEEKLKGAKNEEDKRAAEEAMRLALGTAKKERNFLLKEKLEKAVKSENLAELEPAVAAVKKEKVPDCSEFVAKAEDLIKKLRAASKLKDATAARKIAELELALDAVRKGGWQKDLESSVNNATALLEKLRRLELRKRAVLELSQRVIAELKSYSQPPALVHQVMIATFLLLGSPEKETKSWQATQILIGKTGKTSLKRKVAECKVEKISAAVAQRVATILSRYEFVTVQDTSLGCAAFYSWAEGMVEEVCSLANRSLS